jgi:hypothetical protein
MSDKLRDSNAPRTQDAIDRLIAQAPPLTDEARRRLAGLVATGKVKR